MKMIATLTDDKKQKIKMLNSSNAKNSKTSIRFLAKVIETTISCMAAAKLGVTFYQGLECDKIVVENE